MRLFNSVHRKRWAFLLALLLLILTVGLAPGTAQAQGGIAISGSFYQQVFRIPQGSSVGGPSIDVVVFNTGGDPLSVKLTTQVPLGVQITLSQDDFTLAPGGQQQVFVGIEVTKNATPGEYALGISAETYANTSSGIHLAGSAQQTAKLVVTGDSCMVSLQAKSPDGKPIVTMVRLYRIISGQNYEVAFSDTGVINLKVAPGDFVALSYIRGQKVAEETFSVAAGESKSISLSGATVFFEDFGAVPNYQKGSGKLAFVQFVYTVKNLYQKVDKAEVTLSVSRDGSKADETSLITLNPLEMGRVGLNYNYIPADGWRNGTYAFKLQLKLDGKSYAFSQEQQIKVTDSANGPTQGVGMNLPVTIGIAAAVVIAALGILLLLRRRRHE